jgi:hypothetical protein
MNSRTKGHNAERKYAKVFKALGYTCTTTRYSSRLKDNCKIDLDGIPFNVQIKAGYKRGINYQNILKEMVEKITQYLPDIINLPKLIIHEKDVGKGHKRTELDTIVSMTFEDFKKIINNKNLNI